MDILPYQFLFLVICIGAGAYINRKNFGGVEQKVFGFYLPKPVITSIISVILGLLLWIVINILLLKFRSP
ncbi:hypothetical protein HY357_01515 [Candidatus Roizmanbacteria bacterium]|nr:hypothetical protein [Candidatus Roizmanbacteria bacterium]